MTSLPDPAARERWLVATTEYAGLTAYTGGIGTHYAALLPALVAQGVAVDLVVFADGAPWVDADLRGVRLGAVHRTDGMPPLRALGYRAREVRRAFDAGTYDRVFLPEWSALGADLPRDAPLLTNLATSTRIAHDVSGLRLRDFPRGQRVWLARQRAREARQIRRSAGLIAISTAMLERTRAVAGALPRARVVPNCVDLDAVRASACGSLPAGWPPTEGPVVLFLGRAERRKGVVDAFHAFARVLERVPAARLVVAGAGGDARFEPTRAALAALLPPSGRDRVTWLGHVPGASVAAAIGAADVALCPSRWEGFGNVALEVKAVGTPLVVTSGSGFDDFCIDGVDCAMVPPADPSALAAAVVRMLRDPAWAHGLAATAATRVDAFAPGPVARALRRAADELLGRVAR